MTDAVNYSTLKHMRPPDGSPMHYRWAADHKAEETPAMLLGRLIHTAVFEPDRLMLEYMAWDGDRRGKEYQAFLATATEAGRTVVKVSEWEQARSIRRALMAVPEIAARLNDPGEAEAVLEWVNPETGMLCRGRADWIGPGYILDLKTTGHGIEPRQFATNSWRMGYWMQAAMYQEGYAQTRGGDCPRFGIIAAETNPPYAARLYWLAPTGLIAAWDEFVSCLRTVQACAASGAWPGPEGETELDAPGWVSGGDVDFGGIGGEE